MSTTEYLEQLDESQLEYAIIEAERLLQGKRDEKKMKLYVVQGKHVNEGCFAENEFDKAKQKLCELIMSDEFKPTDIRPLGQDHPIIIKKLVPESEVPEWMDLNK